ncbi:MAG TPA: co-chaperone GroES, partial [bacterium]|nr:co-chaperone GroES [bacterium]
KLMDNGERQKMQVKVGDKILFGKYSGTEVKINGEEHLILKEDDVLAVVE